MGKDIDRNITRQLWERLKNTFSRNDVIPIENGGTGENSISNTFLHRYSKNEFKLYEGFSFGNNFNIYFDINEKSIFLSGNIDVIRNPNINSTLFGYIKVDFFKNHYNIDKIAVGIYGLKISVNNGFIYFYSDFNDNILNAAYRYIIPI
mgnify:CR=1 FL=1